MGVDWIDRISAEGNGDGFSIGCELSRKEGKGIDPSVRVSWGSLWIYYSFLCLFNQVLTPFQGNPLLERSQ